MRRRYLGVSIGEDSLQAVCLKKKSGRFQASWAMSDLSGIEPAVDTPMLADAEAFSDTVRQLLKPLAGNEDRLGLSLPIACGRTLLLQLPNRPDSAEEEKRMLKWKLRELVSCKPEEMRMAYERLSCHEDGTCRYAVHAVRETIFAQLIEAFDRAGFQVDFACFKSFNIWRQAVNLGLLLGRHLFLALDGCNLTLLTATNQQLNACRSVYRLDSGELAAEIARTLADWKRQKLIEAETACFLFNEGQEETVLVQQFSGYIGQEVTSLSCHERIDWDQARPATRLQRHNLSAAAAAAQLLAGD